MKQKYKINYLLILKFDIKLDDNSPSNIEYEVYNPYTKEKLDLSICRNEKINIEIPKILDEHSIILYQNISSFRYDVFNKNDPFYNEICTVYSSEDNTDVLLIDRRLSYYKKSLLFCENRCEYSNYNADRKAVTFKCEVKKNNVFNSYNFVLFKYRKNIIELISQVYPKYSYNKISSPPKKNASKNSNKNNSKTNLIHKNEQLKTIKKKREIKRKIIKEITKIRIV